jgi:mono/diheme cytochrome c family protein
MNDLLSKYKKFTSEPGRIFGLIYPYILFIIIAIGLYFISNLDQIARQKVPPALPDTTMITDLTVQEPRTIPPINILEYASPSPELLEKGKEGYITICVSCHGDNGSGDGPAGAGLNPVPRDFTNKDGWKNGSKLSQIYTTLEEGIAGTGMISYNYLAPADRIAMAHYIRETFVPDPPSDSQDELLALDQLYSLSSGKEIPAQIPVKAAVDLIIDENKSTVQNLVQKLSRISEDRAEEGARIFNIVSDNKIKALTTLSSSADWKQNQEKFYSTIIYSAGNNGFTSKIFILADSEWDALFNYMSRLF